MSKGYKPIDIHIDSFKDLSKYVSSSENSQPFVVVMFTAGFCAPCKRVKARIFNEDDEKNGLAFKHREKVVFFYLDIQTNQKITSDMKVESIPHFFFLRRVTDSFEIVSDIKGGDVEKGLKTLGL